MTCTNHPERETDVTCHGCNRPFCADCVVRFEKLSLCAGCKAKFLADVDERKPAPARSAPAARRSTDDRTVEPARESHRPAHAPTRPPAGPRLPWIGGATALAFALLFVFVIAGSLLVQYRQWRSDRNLADAFARVATAGAAVERFHAATGNWPESLNALVPKYLAEIPLDPYGGPLHYASGKSGRRIWSIGPDGKDDHGEPPADIALLVEPAG